MIVGTTLERNTATRNLARLLLVAVAVGLSALGCGTGGAELGQVTGKVTLDGQPLPNAFVEFTPTGSGGSVSYGKTDQNGEYEMEFSRGVSGAWIGENEVSITTADVTVIDGEEAEIPEKVPARYNEETELRCEVTSGSVRLDFDLTSGEGGGEPAPEPEPEPEPEAEPEAEE